MGYSSLMNVKLLYKEERLSDTGAEVNEVIDNTAGHFNDMTVTWYTAAEEMC